MVSAITTPSIFSDRDSFLDHRDFDEEVIRAPSSISNVVTTAVTDFLQRCGTYKLMASIGTLNLPQ